MHVHAQREVFRLSCVHVLQKESRMTATATATVTATWGESTTSQITMQGCAHRQFDRIDNLRHLREHTVDWKPVHRAASHSHLLCDLLLFLVNVNILALFIPLELL